MGKNNYKFETLQLHVGQENPDAATGARIVPRTIAKDNIIKTTFFIT